MSSNNKEAPRLVKLKPLKLKMRQKPGRGTSDPNQIIDNLIENWEDIKNSLKALSEEEQDEMKQFFNEFTEEADSLGDSLFGDDASEFKTDIGFISDDAKKNFTEKLIEIGFIEQDN